MPNRLWYDQTAGIVGLFLLVSALYIWGLSPTIAWRDSSEFVTLAHTLGISHPAGSPTYSLLAKPITFLPLGSITLRANAFSALAGVICVILLFALLYELLAASSPRVRCAAALSGALFLSVSESFWRFSEVAEVYTLQNCFIVILLLLLLKARTCTPSIQTRYYWLFAFLYGLSAGAHATMAFFVPAFLGFIGLTEPCIFTGKGLAFLAFFFILGFAVYLYLPIRSLTEPAFDWGDPQTWRQFLMHISDRKDSAVHTVFYWRQLPYQIRLYLTHLANEFSTLGFVLGLLGYLYVLYKDKSLWLLLTLVFLGNVVFFIRIWEIASGFIPSFVIFALWIGFGVQACLTVMITLYERGNLRLPRIAVYACLFGGIVVTLYTTFTRHRAVANQADNYSAALYGQQLLEQLPSDAILFSEYAWFPLLYLQQVERQRPDLTVILQGEVFAPSYYTRVSQERFPHIRLVTSDTPVVMSTVEYFWRLARLNATDHPLFWDPEARYQKDLGAYLLPRGLLFAFTPHDKVEITPEILRNHWQLLSRSIERILQDTLEDSATGLLAHKLNLIALHLRRIGLETEAAKTYQAILTMRPHDKGTRNNYGTLLLSQGQLPEAREQFDAAYNQDPINPTFNKNMGKLMLRLGDNAQATSFFERALSFGAVEADVYDQLGIAYARLSQFPAARRALQSALKLLTEQNAQHPPEDHVQTKIVTVQERLHRVEQRMQADSPSR